MARAPGLSLVNLFAARPSVQCTDITSAVVPVSPSVRVCVCSLKLQKAQYNQGAFVRFSAVHSHNEPNRAQLLARGVYDDDAQHCNAIIVCANAAAGLCKRHIHRAMRQ